MDAKGIAGISQQQLDALFSAHEAGSIPDGEAKGTAIVAPGTAFSPALAELVNMDLPSIGKVTVQDPFTAERWQYTMPGGGRGFTRVPSLVSIWSTAPFLVNNRLGAYTGDPSVAGRMAA